MRSGSLAGQMRLPLRQGGSAGRTMCMALGRSRPSAADDGQGAGREGTGGDSGGSGPGGLRIAAAGGITLDSLPDLLPLRPEVMIIGSAITKAPDPGKAAREFKERIKAFRNQR